MKFRRKSAAQPSGSASEPEPVTPPEPGSGPFDIDDLDVEHDGVERVDLGSLLVVPGQGRDIRIQVDEATQAVQSVVLAGQDGALEVKAFAAPRNGDLWSQVRPQIAADMAQRGGIATEREGRFGTELACQLTVKRPDGTQATQPSRIVGVNGPRWLLRATFLGRPAMEPDSAQEWEAVLGDVVVRRGGEAMPVGDALPITMPSSARRVD
ncbi:DUF3710 domain-containing protein [Nocardioides sp.]|uniref:DUF3710 domain-containing protein n=1 Tax=Nocardioides sp. TaxID=35761 RepID=UPI002734248C|nr:DUF3710 domain-containing protein [Nocardioides sp.]MDP3890408.1 DUF3710 domain-containing protein [Nocardioides sp.]